MSNIAVQGGATGTGTFTLLAPSTSTNRTISLPDATGTMLTDQSNILTQTKAALNASNGAPIYACRSWVNFNGTGTVAIRASGNVSSITDGGVGSYSVNFAIAMPDANYVTVAEKAHAATENNCNINMGAPAVGFISFRLIEGGIPADPSYVYVAVFR